MDGEETNFTVRLTSRNAARLLFARHHGIINVLGSPVGNGEFTHDFATDKVRKSQELLQETEALGAHDNAASA